MTKTICTERLAGRIENGKPAVAEFQLERIFLLVATEADGSRETAFSSRSRLEIPTEEF
jgi:hypothetical protein